MQSGVSDLNTTNETKTTYENLKKINALLTEERSESSLSGELKSSRRRLDGVLAKIKAREDEFKRERYAREAAEREAEEAALRAQEEGESEFAETAAEDFAETVVAEEALEVEVAETPAAPADEPVVQAVPEQPAAVEAPAAAAPVAAEEPVEVPQPQPVEPAAKAEPEPKPVAAAPVADAHKKPAEGGKPAESAKPEPKAAEKAPETPAEPAKPVKKKIIIESVVRQYQEEQARKELARQRKLDPNFGKTQPGAAGQNINSRFINNNTRVRKDGFMSDMPGRGPRPAGPGRPMGARPGAPGGKFTAPAVVVDRSTAAAAPKKKTPEKSYDADKKMSKKALINRGFITTNNNGLEDRMGSRKVKFKRKADKQLDRIKIEHAVVNSDDIPIKVLSDKLGITAAEIIKRLFKENIIKTINESVDFDVAAFLAADLGIELELKMDKSAEELLSDEFVEDNTNLVRRPPVVTVMGHVDHGKTSLLDAIRKTNVTGGEAGGITQHIGAYQVKCGSELITFIDTPGHEAFTAMRARGAQVTDIAILVVAADDGVMPQTVEAINHAKAAKVPIIVAINKMDKPTANPERIKQQLTEHGILPEDWGGDSIMVPVSAHSGEGIDKLLESILLVADVQELQANPKNAAKGAIIEAKLDKGKGPVATVLIQNGTLRVGDNIISGTATGRVRAMLDDKGRNVKEAPPSAAVAVLGFSEVPEAGETVFALESNLSKQVLEERINKIKQDKMKAESKMTLEEILSMTAEGEVKALNLIIKADVQGSGEAVKQAILKLSNPEVKINIVHAGVGAVNESDVTLASAAKAIVIGFNVRPDTNAKTIAEREKIDLRLYRIIYEAIDDITLAMKGMVAPKFKENVLGHAEVRSAFKITGVGMVAGSYVTDGKIVRSAKVRLMRGGEVLRDGEILALKRFKDDAKEVAQGFECGISIKDFNDIKEGDTIECYEMEEIKE